MPFQTFEAQPAASSLAGLGAAVVGELGAAAASDAAVGKLLAGCTPSRVTVVSTQLLMDTHSSVVQAALVRRCAVRGL